ncbi:Rieske domain-containing protein-like [Haliotis rubra]|uniref:Rieske domain-containing protein-like n=1 Tax=Haliotis rubra TaxID=36100 RepID=UPI001EE51271|nr:Rieske domain-containing protein-like [Haliotis rubra]
MSAGEVGEEVFVCHEADLVGSDRKRVTVCGRDVFIVKVRGQFYAMDSFCYHAGGPLHSGQIEDIGQWTCVRCPWHNYMICVANGEGIYESIDPFNLNKPPEMKSKGVKQRTHAVIRRDGKLFVRLTNIDNTVESDHYNCPEYREKYNLR